MEARHWGVVERKDVEKGTYHRTHSAYAIAAFHEALRITLSQGLAAHASTLQLRNLLSNMVHFVNT